jgi:hypothetical protein
MSVVRTCCNRELAGSCIYCCDGRYCTNTEEVVYDWLDSSCTGYMNKEVFVEQLKDMEEDEDGNN